MAGKVVGLDIGTHGVRAAEVSFGRGLPTLQRFGQVALPFGAVVGGEVVDAPTVAALQAMGHTVNTGESTWGNLQSVAWDKQASTLGVGTDPRNPVGRGEVLLAPAP